MTRMGRGARAFAALLVLVASLTALPAALAVTIGNPLVVLPDVLAGDITDAVLIALLASLAWVAWAQFALAVLAELVAVAIRTPLPRGVPGVLSGQQQLARSLVNAVFLLGPLTASTLLTPAAFSTLPAASPVSSTAAVTAETGLASPGPTAVHAPTTPTGTPAVADAEPAEPTTEYTIPSGDGPATLWDIAAAHLGAGERWQEIWQLNEGRAQPDGAVMSSPRRLLPGWTVLVPTSTTPAVPAGVEVLVEPGDTLSDLAAEHARTADWQPAWKANAGRS
ncbi:MAG: LysM peptidoglycan-binding domain-containing protein, partial [Actinobacteria bacterium]|nr:LysM peptidoglycan-binding domain-containing protein [Actinomycetota bacterium]